MKSEIYNLIILDESGSMGCVWDQTINGCNETINTIRAAQTKFEDTQDHYVSIFAFQDGCQPSRYLCKNVPARTVDHISRRDYEPGGMTPLYDAVGATLTDLKAVVKDKELALGNVTIITDGEENSSRHYDALRVAKMIDGLKEIGWNFNFIGANIDVKKAASRLNIENSMAFQQTEEGTRAMFERERKSRMRWQERTNDILCDAMSSPCPAEPEAMYARFRESASQYFDEDQDKA